MFSAPVPKFRLSSLYLGSNDFQQPLHTRLRPPKRHSSLLSKSFILSRVYHIRDLGDFSTYRLGKFPRIFQHGISTNAIVPRLYCRIAISHVYIFDVAHL